MISLGFGELQTALWEAKPRGIPRPPARAAAPAAHWNQLGASDLQHTKQLPLPIFFHEF